MIWGILYAIGVWITYVIVRVFLSDPDYDDDMLACWAMALLWPGVLLVGTFWGIGKLTDRLSAKIRDRINPDEKDTAWEDEES